MFFFHLIKHCWYFIYVKYGFDSLVIIDLVATIFRYNKESSDTFVGLEKANFNWVKTLDQV